jgi:hypothetical protein
MYIGGKLMLLTQHRGYIPKAYLVMISFFT